MGIRDKEIERLQKYAESLGLKVSWKRRVRGGVGAVWELDGEKVALILYQYPSQSKTSIILNFLHELAHHLAYVNQGRELSKSVSKAFSKRDEELTENERRIVYETEKEDAAYRPIIAHELNIKLPIEKIKADIELDEWIYYRFYKDAKDPTQQEIREKRKELKKKYS